VKQIKYVTGFLLFLLAFIFVGEIYVWNLDSFESEYKYVTFYRQEDTTESEMMKVRNLGKKSLDEVVAKLHSLGLDFAKEED